MGDQNNRLMTLVEVVRGKEEGIALPRQGNGIQAQRTDGVIAGKANS